MTTIACTVIEETINVEFENVIVIDSSTHYDYIQLNTGLPTPTHNPGQLYWDEQDQTPAIDLAHTDVRMQIGQESFARVLNLTGTPISNGKVVYVNGVSDDRPTIALADANIEATNYILGVVTHLIGSAGDDRYGYVTTTGIVRGVDTSGWTAGLPLWVSETAGELTQTRPTAPNHAVYVGVPLNSVADGSIFINPDNGLELDELHDVNYPVARADGQLLIWNGSTSRWENTPELRNYKERLYATTTSGNVTIDLANGPVQRFILDAARQFTLPASPGAYAQSFVLIIECATFTPTWAVSPTIEWLTTDGAPPTLVTTANLVNVLTFIWDNVDSRWLAFLSGKETA